MPRPRRLFFYRPTRRPRTTEKRRNDGIGRGKKDEARRDDNNIKKKNAEKGPAIR